MLTGDQLRTRIDSEHQISFSQDADLVNMDILPADAGQGMHLNQVAECESSW